MTTSSSRPARRAVAPGRVRQRTLESYQSALSRSMSAA